MSVAKTSNKSVPAFLNKLYNMVNDSATDDIISWNLDGTSFVVYNHQEFAKSVLPKFFKHSNFSSFVRQLNMYGFHKVPHFTQGSLSVEADDVWEFTNLHFQRGQPDLLYLVSRKKGKDEDNLDLNNIINEISAIKRHQLSISADLKNIQRENQLLWDESASLRNQYSRQQETIDKIVRFLASIFTKNNTVEAPVQNATKMLTETNSFDPLPVNDIFSNPDSTEGKSFSLTFSVQQKIMELMNPVIDMNQSLSSSGGFNAFGNLSLKRKQSSEDVGPSNVNSILASEKVSQDLDALQGRLYSVGESLGIDLDDHLDAALNTDDLAPVAKKLKEVDNDESFFLENQDGLDFDELDKLFELGE